MDLAGQPRFFIGAAVGLIINGVVGLAISRAVLTKTNVAINFFGLSL